MEKPEQTSAETGAGSESGSAKQSGTDAGLNDATAEGANGAAAKAEADPLDQAKEAVKEWERKYLYLTAEFDNYRKRMQKEKSDFLKWGHEDFLREQLQVLDNFERAVQHAKSFAPEKQSPFGQVLLGVEMIMQQLSDTLKNQGLVEIKSIGQKFDPLMHEAVAQEAVAGTEPNTITKEFQKGYMLHGRLLRAARVVTAKHSE